MENEPNSPHATCCQSVMAKQELTNTPNYTRYTCIHHPERNSHPKKNKHTPNKPISSRRPCRVASIWPYYGMSADCLFCKIIDGDIPGKFIYRSEDFVAFNDINPKAPVHILICPRSHTDTFQTSDPAIMAAATTVVQEIAANLGIEDEYTLQINNGAKSGQIVFHLHIHLMSGSAEAAAKIQKILEKAD